MGLDHAQIALLCAMSVYTKIDGTVMLSPAHLAIKMKKTTKWVNQKIKLLEQSGLVSHADGKYFILYSPPHTPPLSVDSKNLVLSNTNSTIPRTRSKNRAKGTDHPIPEDFAITDSMNKWATGKNFKKISLSIETEKFINHAQATNRQQSRWDAAWRNWMIQAEDWSKADGSGKRPKPIDVASTVRKAKERVTRNSNA